MQHTQKHTNNTYINLPPNYRVLTKTQKYKNKIKNLN